MNIKITKKEFFEKYGGIEMEFVSYYKYKFLYYNEEHDLKVWFGDIDSDIYRSEFNAVEVLEPWGADIIYVNIGEEMVDLED